MAKNLLVDWMNKFKANNAINPATNIQSRLANTNTASNVISTPNLPTNTGVNLQAAQQPTQTKLDNLNNQTGIVKLQPRQPSKGEMQRNMNQAFLDKLNGGQQGQSRFIGLQKPYQPNTDLGGNITPEYYQRQAEAQRLEEEKERNKPILNIPTVASEKTEFMSNETNKYADTKKALYDLQGDMYKNNRKLTDDELKQLYPEFNLKELKELQDNLRPVVKKGQGVDDKQISQYFPNLLPQKKEASNAKVEMAEDFDNQLKTAVNRGNKLLGSYNTLSKKGVKYLEDAQEVNEFLNYVKDNYKIPGIVTDYDILNYMRQEIPEINTLMTEMDDLMSAGKKGMTAEDYNTIFENGFDLGEGLSDTANALNNISNAITNYTKDNSSKWERQLNNIGLNGGMITNGLNTASEVLSIPTRMGGGLAGGTAKFGTALERIAKQQNINEDGSTDWNGVATDVIKGGGGALEVGFNTAFAIPTAIFHAANATELGQEITDDTLGLYQEGIQNILDGSFAQDLGLSKDTYLAKWYNSLDEETKADLVNELTVATLHKGSKALKEAKLEGEVAIDAITNAFQRGKGGAMFQAWVEKGLADEGGKLTKGAKQRIVKEGISEFKDALKENFRMYNTVLKNRRGDITANWNTLPDNRTFRQKAESQINQAKETVNEGINTVKEGVNNAVDTVAEGAKNIKPGEIIKNTAETVGKGVKATSDLYNKGKNAVTQGKNAVTNTISKGVNAVKETVNENIVEPYNQGRGKTNDLNKGTSQQVQQPQESNLASETTNKVNGDNYTQKNTNSKTLNKAQIRIQQNENRMNPKAIREFKTRRGEDYGQAMYDRGFTNTRDENIDDMGNYVNDLLKEKDNSLEGIEGNYQDRSLDDMLTYMINYARKTKDYAMQERYAKLADVYKKNKGMSIKAANEMRKEFTYKIKTGFWNEKNAEKIALTTNLYTAVREFLEKIAEENGFTDMGKINNEIALVQHIRKGMIDKADGQSANNAYGINDYILMAEAFSNPKTATVFVGKQLLKNDKIRNKGLNLVIGGRGNSKNRITTATREEVKGKIKDIAQGKKLQEEMKGKDIPALPNGIKLSKVVEIDKRKPTDTTPPTENTPTEKVEKTAPKKKSESKPKNKVTSKKSEVTEKKTEVKEEKKTEQPKAEKQLETRVENKKPEPKGNIKEKIKEATGDTYKDEYGELSKGKKLYRGETYGNNSQVFWTDDKDIAESFGDTTISENDIIMDNPLDVRLPAVKKLLQEEIPGINIDSATSAYKPNIEEKKKLMDWAKENGYDGIIGETSDLGQNYVGNEYIVLNDNGQKNKVTAKKTEATAPKQEENQTKKFTYDEYGQVMNKIGEVEKKINNKLDKQYEQERAEKMSRFEELRDKEDKTDAEGKELVKLQGELNNMSNKYDRLKEEELKKQAPELLQQKEELQQAFDRDWEVAYKKAAKKLAEKEGLQPKEDKKLTTKEEQEARARGLAKPNGVLIYTNSEFKYIPSVKEGMIRLTPEEGKAKFEQQFKSALENGMEITVLTDEQTGETYAYNPYREGENEERDNKPYDSVITETVNKNDVEDFEIKNGDIRINLNPEESYGSSTVVIDLKDFLNNSYMSDYVSESNTENKGTSTAKNKITNSKPIEMDYFEDIDPQALKILTKMGDKWAIDLYDQMTADDQMLMQLYDEMELEDMQQENLSNLGENETAQDIDYQDLAELENETPQMVDIDEGVDATTQLVDEFNNLKPGEFKWIGDNREAGVRKTFGDANIKIPGEGDSVDIYFQPGESGDKMYINLHDTSNTGIRNTNEVLNKLDIPYRIGSEFDEKLNETRYYLENKLTHSKAYFDKNGASWLSVSKTLRGKEIVPRRNAEEQAEYNMQMEQRRAEIEAEREQDRIKAEERKAEEERQQEIDKQMKANLLRYVDIKHNDNPLGRGRTLKDLSEKNSEASNKIRYYGDDVADDAGVWQVLDVLADKNGKIREVWESDSKSSYSYEYYDEELGRNNNISGLNKTQRDYLEYRIKATQTEKRVNNHLDKIENKSLKTRVENKLNEMKKWQDDNGKTQYGTDAQYIDYLVLDKGFTPKEFPTGKTYANGEPKIDYMIVNEKNVGYISSKIENDYAKGLLETPEEELSAEDEAKLDELFTPKTTTEVTGEKNAVTAKQAENEKPKNLVTSRIENTNQEIQEIDKDTYFDDIVKNLKDHPREMFIYKDGSYFYPHYILPSGKVITPENTYWGEVSSEEAARNWLLKEAEEHSEENETKKAEKLKEIVGKTAEKYEATLKRIESDNPMQEIWTSGDYFKYGMGNNQMARAKKESEANAEVGTFKKDVIDGKEGYRIFVAGTKNEAIRAFYEPKTGKTYRIYRGPVIDDSKPYTTKQVERIEKFLQNVDKQLDKETKKEKKEEKQVITQEWLDSLKPDKDGVIELDYKGDERWALGKGKEALIKEGKADGKYLYNYGGAAHPQYMALYIKNGIVYEGRKGLEDQYMTTKQEAVDWLNQKEKDVEHESTERYTQTDYETLPKTISVETEAEKAGPKRIAPDRVKRQQETYDQGLESVKNVLKQSPVKIYELGFKSDRSKAVQNILEERKRIRQLPESEAEKQWNELAKSVYEDLVIKDISKGYRYPEDVTSKFPKAQMKKAVDARARYEKGLFTSFSAKDTRANNQYRDEIGAGIKSQDGKPVTQEQMNEIVDGIRAYSNIFGVDMKKFAEDNNVIYVHLHGGNPFLMGGMSIAGLYRRDAAGNISVSLGGREGVMEKGEDGKMKKSDIKTTTVHEITHAVDGMLEGKLFSDADTEILKKTMNKPSELINYYNRKQEIVARAVEQYAAHQLGKKLYRTALANIDWENGSVEFVEKEANYVDREAYWNQENFDKYVKPIVERNMEEKLKDYKIEQPKTNVLANDKNKITSK